MAGRTRKKGIGCLPMLLLALLIIGGGAFGYLKVTGQTWQEGLGRAELLVMGVVNRVMSGQGLVDDPHRDKQVAYRFAILSDSHEDVTVFPKIVQRIADREDLSFVAFLGDASNAGELAKLTEAKQFLDNITIPVHVLPGDHDRNWLPERDLRNFKQVFGMSATSYSFGKGNELFIFLDNSDSQGGVSRRDWQWLQGVLAEAGQKNIYVFMSTPLYNPYLSFKAMGSQSEEVKKQAVELGKLLAESKVKAVFAGDTHSFSQFRDETNQLEVVTVGAAGTNKNLLPLYVEVEIFSDGSYNAQSVPYQDKE